jgi:thiol-disulfide isomerase/thioredoxin
MLLIFSIHLTYDISLHGNEGNCGCFGALLPMTPIQALIKNIIGMILLGYLYKVTSKTTDKLNFSFLAAITFASVLGVFLVGPMQRKSSDQLTEELMNQMEMSENESNNTVSNEESVSKMEEAEIPKPLEIEQEKGGLKKEEEIEKVVVDEPKFKKSGFASQFSDIDKGRKILCFFAPGCDHCRETAKALTEMASKDPNFPEVKIVFMEEEAELIPDFFAFAGRKYPFKILEVGAFWTVLGGNRDTPGVFYLWNENVVKDYDGINERAFKKEEFKKIVQKPWSEFK